MKGRLILGVPVLAVFAVVCIVNVGVQVHAWFEERDTVAHHQRAREEAAAEDPSIDLSEPPHPYGDLGRAQERLGMIGQQLLLSLAGAIGFGGLAYLGYRKLKRWPR